jgi:hypothetical protein
MKEIKTILTVVSNNGKKAWGILRNDTDPDSEGKITICGVPCKAEDVPHKTRLQQFWKYLKSSVDFIL